MEFNCPERISSMNIIKTIYNVNDTQANQIDTDIDLLKKDILIEKMEEKKISRWESLLGINPSDTDTLDERRYRVKGRVNDGTPYTIKVLKRKLDVLVGENSYTLELGDNLESITCKVDLSSKAMFNDTVNLLEELVPLNMTLETGLLYNNHEVLSQFTHEQLSQYTHQELREGVLG